MVTIKNRQQKIVLWHRTFTVSDNWQIHFIRNVVYVVSINNFKVKHGLQ